MWHSGEYLRGVFTHQPFKKGETIMKRALFLAMVILLVSGFAIAKTAETPITPADLTDLKGAWTGQRSGKAGTNRTDLNINNDSLPLKGDIILHLPPKARRPSPVTFHFIGKIEDGRLKLYWAKRKGSADLGLRKKDDGSMQLTGTLGGPGLSGSVTFKKVK
jgi:hypothetical protein